MTSRLENISENKSKVSVFNVKNTLKSQFVCLYVFAVSPLKIFLQWQGTDPCPMRHGMDMLS